MKVINLLDCESSKKIDNKAKKPRCKLSWHGFILRIFAIMLFAFFAYGSFVTFKIFQLEEKVVATRIVSEENKEKNGKEFERSTLFATAKNFISSKKDGLDGEKDGRINILLVGMGGEGHKGKDLTDTIMVVSIDQNDYQVAMLSIPRDLFVKVEGRGYSTKINAVYAHESRKGKNNFEKYSEDEEVLKANAEAEAMGQLMDVVENVIGQEMHYYIALDFDGFKEIIGELGGIDVDVKDDIYDPRYPGPNFSYQTFEIEKGFQHLDAETALKYARVRHTKGGDFGRAERQQQVLIAAKKKALSLKFLTNPLKVNSMINVLGDHLKTNIQLSEVPSFLHLAKNVNIYQATTKVLDAWSRDSLLGSTHVPMGGVMAYVLIPRARNYSEVHELAENIFNLNKIKERKEKIKGEDAKIVVLFDDYEDHYRVKKIFGAFGYKKVEMKKSKTKCSESENIITDYSEKTKLYTLDDLAKKLNTNVSCSEDEDFKYDISVCLSKDTIEYFEKQAKDEEEDKKLKEESEKSKKKE